MAVPNIGVPHVVLPPPDLGGGRVIADLTSYLRHNAVFNALDFGAVGDGVTDDSPGIAEALAAAQGAGGGVVVLPRPTGASYVLGSALAIPDTVHLVGQGKGVLVQTLVTVGASITLGSYTRVANLMLQGNRISAPLTPVGVAATGGKHVLVQNVVAAEFTDACVRFTNMIRSALWHCELNHAVNAGSTALAFDLADGFNNGIVVLGGEIRGSSLGFRAGRGADAVTLLGTVIESNGVGAQWKCCDGIRFAGVHFEANAIRDFEGLADVNYDDPATNIMFDSCHHVNSPAMGIVRNTATVVFFNSNPTPKTQGAPSTRVVTLGDGTQNPVVVGRSDTVFVNEAGKVVHVAPVSHLQENELQFSAALSNALWQRTGPITGVEDAASDGMLFFDGSPAMRVIVDGTCNKNNPARVAQSFAAQKGHLLGSRVWVRMAAGKTGTLYPYIGGSVAVTGSQLVAGAPHRLDLTDEWREITWAGVVPLADAGANSVLGWWFFPDDGVVATDFYFARPQGWFDSLETPQYVGTAGAVVTRRPALTDASTVVGTAFNLTKQAVAGSRGGNAALASLLTGLAAQGLITDNTTA